MNSRHIPSRLETEVRNRDTQCIYCGVRFDTTRSNTASWEHITNDAQIITRENIALCCVACNASKGAKLLAHRLHSPYCIQKNITPDTIAPIARNALSHPPSRGDTHDLQEPLL